MRIIMIAGVLLLLGSSASADPSVHDAVPLKNAPPLIDGEPLKNAGTLKDFAPANDGSPSKDVPPSKDESPSADASTPKDLSPSESESISANEHHVLKGSVRHKRSAGFGLFGKRWNAEDYRALNYGVIGIVSTHFMFSKTVRVLQVFPACPAAQAGIRPGDVIIKIADHVVDGKENQRTTWHTADGVAGTHVDYVVRRHHKIITFDLTRMNIEDIQNNQIRSMYEHLLSKYGPPGDARHSQDETGQESNQAE